MIVHEVARCNVDQAGVVGQCSTILQTDNAWVHTPHRTCAIGAIRLHDFDVLSKFALSLACPGGRRVHASVCCWAGLGGKCRRTWCNRHARCCGCVLHRCWLDQEAKQACMCNFDWTHRMRGRMQVCASHTHVTSYVLYESTAHKVSLVGIWRVVAGNAKVYSSTCPLRRQGHKSSHRLPDTEEHCNAGRYMQCTQTSTKHTGTHNTFSFFSTRMAV